MNEPSIMVAYQEADIPNHPNFPKAIAIKVGVGRGSLLFDKGSLDAWRDERTMKKIENIKRNIAREAKRLKKYESVLQTIQTTKGDSNVR